MRWKLDLLLWPWDQETEFPVKDCWLSRPKNARGSKSTYKLLMILFFDSTGMIYMHWVPTGQTVNKEYYVEVLREFSKRFLEHSSNRASGISTRTMHQSTIPSLSQTIWPKWASRQFLTVPIVQTLLPVIFGYSLSSEAVVMRQLRRWERLWQKSLTLLHKKTSMGSSEVVAQYKCIASGGDYFEGD